MSARSSPAPGLREDQPGSGPVPCDRQGLARPQSAGDDPFREVRAASAAQPPSRTLCQGRRAAELRRPWLDQVGAGFARCWNRSSAGVLKLTSLAAERLHGDDTTAICRSWPRARPTPRRCWVYVRDDRPFGGTVPPAAMFYYSRDRAGEHPQAHPRQLRWDFPGRRLWRIQQAVRAGSQAGADPGGGSAGSTPAARSFIMADLRPRMPVARRKAKPRHRSRRWPLRRVRRIDALFEIERSINGQSAEQRRAVRRELSAPLVADLESWMRGATCQALARQ